MGVIKDVSEALNDVAEGIKHIRTVAEAIRDGKDYLKVSHPEIRQELTAMCAEMRNTLTAVAAASAILTHFRFTVTGNALDMEPSRFNNHLIAHKERAAQVATSLQAMRGHCHEIKKHAESLKKRAESLNLSRLLLLFGINSAERDQEVAAALEQIYDDEMQGYVLVNKLTVALRKSLDEVANALGPAGTMLPANVPIAALLLGEYADAFGTLESTSNYLALDLQQSIDSMEGYV